MDDIQVYFRAISKHWGTLVTGGTCIGVLGIYQGTGHVVRPWVYWTVALVALFIAFYRAWLDEHKKVLLLEQLQKPKLGLKDKTLALSTSILEFIYERAVATPKVPLVPRFGMALGNDGAAFLESMEKFRIEQQELNTYNKNTLGLYEVRYRRGVGEAIVSAKSLGLDSSRLERYASDLLEEGNPIHDGPRVSIPIASTIEEVGKELGILADQIKYP